MKEAIKSYFDETIKLMNSISVSIGKRKVDLFQGIEESCRLVKLVANKDNKVIFIGNGGSAAIASHMAIDFWKNGGIRATAFNDGSLLTCVSNDFGYKHVFEKPLQMFANDGDVLVAISSSGKSENIMQGVDAAQSKGCSVITLSGFDKSNPLRSKGIYNFYVPASEYGPVEITHQYICHCILDTIMLVK